MPTRDLDLYLDDDFTGAILADADTMSQIDYHAVPGPTAQWSVPNAYTDVPQLTITWTAQAGKLIALATICFTNATGTFTAAMLKVLLDEVMLSPNAMYQTVPGVHSAVITGAFGADIAAGIHTLKVQARALANNLLIISAAPANARLTAIVFPTSMIAP
jgi:hypothetical protein